MAVVLDANVAMAIVKGEEEGLAIKSLILEGEEVVAPDLFRLEVASSVWKYVHAGYMDRKDATAYCMAACDLPTRYVRQNDFVPQVLHMAMRIEHSVYDSTYLVLAQMLGATLATLDRRLVNLCEQEGIDCVHPAQGL